MTQRLFQSIEDTCEQLNVKSAAPSFTRDRFSTGTYHATALASAG
ncbi:MAG: hypothetical protein ACREQ2_08740 [Candidatus Binatia bacterium]